MIEYNKIVNSDNSGKLFQKLSKVKKPQKSEKFIYLKKLRFLTSNIKLAYIEIRFSYTKLTMKNY